MRQMFSVRQILPKPKQKGKPGPKGRKEKIPLALREQVWIHRMGRVFEGKCPVTWCQNTITVFDFESGHNLPESKGGETNVTNLIPLCSRCNKGMGNRFTIEEWCLKFQSSAAETPTKHIESHIQRSILSRFFCCF